MIKKLLLSLFILFFAFVEAKEVSVVFSRTTPPFVFDTGGGIGYDIVQESLSYKNHTIKPVYVNISRGVEMFKNGLVDANALLQEETDVEAFYSDIFIQYQNCVFTLKSSNIDIQKIEDITNYHTIGFQNAHLYLGKEFEAITKMAKEKYTELADQKKQVHMFYKNHTQAVVMDIQIFKYYTAMLESENKIEPNILFEEKCLFAPTKYQVAFKEALIRDDFNEGLKQIIKNGTYDKIFERYGKNYFELKK